TPDVVVAPRQYAVASTASRAPGAARSVDASMACGTPFCESSIVTSWSETNATAANSVARPFLQIDRAIVIGPIVVPHDRNATKSFFGLENTLDLFLSAWISRRAVRAALDAQCFWK